MELRIDMHVHSEKSYDGSLSVESIAAVAKGRGLTGVCITDHDISYTGPDEIFGVNIYSGIEISTDEGHLLGLFLDAPVEPTKDFKEAAKRIREAGGIAVLAHPYQNRRMKPEKRYIHIAELARELDGIEIYNSRAESKVKRANEYAKMTAEDLNLLQSVGSDAHVGREIGNAFIIIKSENRDSVSLKKELAKLDYYMLGTFSYRIYTAKSQYIKLKKTKANFLKYIIWFLFTFKCFVLDMIDRVRK